MNPARPTLGSGHRPDGGQAPVPARPGGTRDVRPALAAESRALPAGLLIAAAAAGALAADVARVGLPELLPWLWFGAMLASLAGRYLLAARAADQPGAVRADSTAVRWVTASHLADATLWLALFGLLWPFGAPPPIATVFAAGASMLLGTLTLRELRGALLGWLLLWALTVAVLVAADAGRSSMLYLGLPAWWAAVTWLGVGRLIAPAATSAPPTIGPSSRFSATRLGWNAAVRAMPLPVVVVRAGHIVEINAAASQFIGREPADLIGRRIDECLGVHPAGSLDPTLPGSRELFAVSVRSALRGAGAEVAGARVRCVDPGRADSTVVVTLVPVPAGQATAVPTRPEVQVPPGAGGESLLADAQRLAEWVGGPHARPWYRDPSGHLHLPPEFKVPPETLPGVGVTVPGSPGLATVAPASASAQSIPVAALPARLGGPSVAPQGRSTAAPAGEPFPLAHLVGAAERPALDALYAEHVRAGRMFDERIRLRNIAGGLRPVRVVCVQRAGSAAGRSAVIGLIAPVRAETHAAPVAPSEVLGHLPMLIWIVDPAGRLVHVRPGSGGDVRRWGVKLDPATDPNWADAIEFHESSREAVLKALQGALSGRPTFDLLNYRVGQTGGRIALRSHFVPYAMSGPVGATQHGVLALDTIASAQELMGYDRLRRSKAQYKALVEASPSLIWAIDIDDRFTFLSKRACRETYGYSVGELIGKPFDALLDPGVDQFAARQALGALRAGEALRGFEIVKRARSGQRLLVSVSAATLKAPDGTYAGAIGMSVDLTGLKQRERRLSEALRIERMVLDSAGQAIAVIKDGRVARCNDAFVQLLRVEPAELARVPIVQYFAEAQDWLELCAVAEERRGADRAATREVRMNRRGRPGSTALEQAWCQLTARSIAPGEYVLVLTDIDSIRRREAHALHDAQHDELTGLPNRRLFSERSTAVLSGTSLRAGSCAVVVIDLDGFKSVNDVHGHRIGDAVLREVAARLSRVMRPQDTVARRGGDEFAVLLPDAGSRADIENIAERILREIEQPVPLAAGQWCQLSASMGIALAPEHGRDLERLLQLADHAMYEAKVSGKNTWAFATPGGASGNVTPIGARAGRAT